MAFCWGLRVQGLNKTLGTRALCSRLVLGRQSPAVRARDWFFTPSSSSSFLRRRCQHHRRPCCRRWLHYRRQASPRRRQRLLLLRFVRRSAHAGDGGDGREEFMMDKRSRWLVLGKQRPCRVCREFVCEKVHGGRHVSARRRGRAHPQHLSEGCEGASASAVSSADAVPTERYSCSSTTLRTTQPQPPFTALAKGSSSSRHISTSAVQNAPSARQTCGPNRIVPGRSHGADAAFKENHRPEQVVSPRHRTTLTPLSLVSG